MSRFKKGDWVAEIDGEKPQLGVVFEAYADAFEGEELIDIVMYTWNGERVGRLSPPEGGPTKFEPALPANKYALIDEPIFPLTREGLSGNWKNSLHFKK